MEFVQEVMWVAKTWLDPTPDPELMGHDLDLSRPELLPLMRRYSGRPQTRPFLAPPTALLVTRRPGEEVSVREALEDVGWHATTCDGPGIAACPLRRGEPCALRKSVDAAVVFVDAAGQHSGAALRLRCAGDSSSPGVVAVAGRLDAMRRSGNVATLGSLRGPRAVLDAIAELLAPDSGIE